MFKHREIYYLPLIISKLDMEMEKFYADFYNEGYWVKYNKNRLKKRKNGFNGNGKVNSNGHNIR